MMMKLTRKEQQLLMSAMIRDYLQSHCEHKTWKKAGVFTLGDFTDDIIECTECGKTKILSDLKENERMVD